MAEDKERLGPLAAPRRYKLEYTASALREFKAMESGLQSRISEKIIALADNPLPAGARKLQGLENHFRIRVGDYRVIYRIERERIVVVIVRIGHRRDVYR